MTSKVLVKLPVVPFSQRKKSSSIDIKSLTNKNEENDDSKFHGTNIIDKIFQLEQNMKFLQEQHQLTLVALHQEVDILRQRNRDLQFQLVFSKEIKSNSPLTTPEDLKGSPTMVNVTPLQVEILEKELQDLKCLMKESKAQNLQLTQIIEKQKIIIENIEKSKENCKLSEVGVQVDSTYLSDLQRRLEDTESLVRRLRRENEEQNKEISALKSMNTYSNRSSNIRSRGSPNSFHNRGLSHEMNPDDNFQKFPPLQNYWQRNSRGNHSYERERNSQTDYHRNRQYKEHKDYKSEMDNTVLPQVQNGSVRVDNSSSYPPFFRARSNYTSENYYKDGINRKYRGQKSQRDRRDQDSREYQQIHKDKDQRYKDFSGSSKNIRSFNNI